MRQFHRVNGGGECVGGEAGWDTRGFGVVGGMVWWVWIREFYCSEEFVELAAPVK
jgi:hypothetical protein